MNPLLRFLLLALLLGPLASCATKRHGEIVVSVADQRLALFDKENKMERVYKVSTSQFGLGDKPGSFYTPIGSLEIAKKIGKGAPEGAVFKSRHRTGEVLKPNAPGRDPIVTRILWLKGTSDSTQSAFNRYIYIHGTPQESTLGRPSSFGCVRMASGDVIDLFDRVSEGDPVIITTQRLSIVGRIRAGLAARSRARAEDREQERLLAAAKAQQDAERAAAIMKSPPESAEPESPAEARIARTGQEPAVEKESS